MIWLSELKEGARAAFLPLVGHFTTPFRHTVGNHRADLRKIGHLSAGLAAKATLTCKMACVYAVTALVGFQEKWLLSADIVRSESDVGGISDKR